MDINLDFTLLNVGYSEPNKKWNWDKVCSPFARIYYVTDGEAQIRMGDKKYLLHPNKLYLIPPFTLHNNVCDNIFKHYYIHFYEKTKNKESIFDRYYFPLEIDATPLHLQLVKLLLTNNPERYLREIDPQVYDNAPTISRYIADNINTPFYTVMEMKGILYQLMSGFFKLSNSKSTDKDRRVVKCLQYIHENINYNLTVAQLAEIACVSKDHLIRIFKSNTKYTPLQYVNLKKIEQAQLLLISSTKSINDIANLLSIENISYFNRLFKQHTEFTPSEFREKHRNV